MLLLDFIRYQQSLTGTKIGCREGDCGACTVLVGELTDGKILYRSATSCLLPLGNVRCRHIVTIEGINVPGLNAVQQAFAEEGATQCGFCTPGFIVSLTGFCLDAKMPAYEKAVDSVNGNICRCTGYKSIERAANSVTSLIAARGSMDNLDFAIRNNIVPEYFKGIPSRLKQLSEHVPATRQAGQRFLAGGTDLYVQRPEEMPGDSLWFLNHQKDIKEIHCRDGICEIGAAVVVADLAEHPVLTQHFPGLNKFIKLVSSTQIRNMATIAGNFVNASPIGDLTIFFLALDANLTICNRASRRSVPLREFYLGYKTLDKATDEFIEKISFTLPLVSDLFNFEKVSKRTNLDIASVNTAIFFKMNNGRIIEAGLSAGGVGPVPIYLKQASLFLADKEITTEVIKELIIRVQLEIAPISDVRGTAGYKRLLLAQLIKAHFITLFPALPVNKLLQAL